VNVVLPRKEERDPDIWVHKKRINSFAQKTREKSEFTTSEGWIDRRKTRHSVRFVSIYGEKLFTNAKAAKKISVKFQEIFEQYEPLHFQGYNIDETGLNYKILLNKTLASSNDTVTGTTL